MRFIEWAQRRLLAHGFNPGKVDSMWGRNTRNAVIAFQKAKNLSQTGMLDEPTVLKLRAKSDLGDIPDIEPGAELHEQFPWIQLVLQKKGLHEGKNNKELSRFLKSDGKTLGDPSKLPWCGDLVETAIALALPREALPTNPYLARNWLKYGAPQAAPAYGDVLVFWRGKPKGTSGHVGFYVGEDATHFHVLGGNQSNTISVARIAKSRLLGARSPLSGGPYKRIRVRVNAKGVPVTINEA